MIPENIKALIEKNIYKINNHPLCILKSIIFNHFSDFNKIEDLPIEVNIKNNFDDLLIPNSHVSRKHSDTFYVNENTVLRTHMTAHLSNLAKKLDNYLICGDVYRKDAIDRSHFPVFHQMDGFCIVDNPEKNLRDHISNLIVSLLGENIKYKFLEDKNHKNIYFPFTFNSFEVEVEIETDTGPKLLELLGGGTVEPEIMNKIGKSGQKAWAFGLGLERIAMVLFDIPDIRYFWETDERFLKQFHSDKIIKFQPYSKCPVCYKDISFWLNDQFNENEFYSLIREIGLGLIESVCLLDSYINQKSNKQSNCYRISYRHPSKTLTNYEVDVIQNNIITSLKNNLNLEIR